MTCPEYQNLLPAFHRAELKEEEARILRRHLSSCMSCSLENERVMTVERSVQRIRAIQPIPPDGDVMTAEVMQRIRSMRSSRQDQDARGWLAELFSFVQRPEVRMAYAMVVSLSLGLFVYQQGETFARVRGLEERIAQKKGIRMDIRFTLDAAQAQAIINLGQFSLPPALEREFIVLDRQTVAKGLAFMEQQVLPGLRFPEPSASQRSTLESTLREIKRTLWIR